METRRIFTEILDYTSRRRDDTVIEKKLLWWSKKTEEESHMLTLSIESIKDTLLMAVFAFNEDNNLVAAGGVFLPRTHDQSEPFHNGKKVVEIGTNFVLPEYRRQGIGKQLIDVRLKYAKENDWVPVSISSNPVVQKLFTHFDGSLMEEHEECSELRQLLCLKCENGDACKCCPLIPRCGWIF